MLKPAETTPLTALLFCDVLRQAELPPGVVNIVTGDGRTGAALVKHPDVDKIAFTGSTEVGKAIQRELAGTGKKLTLELGGKAANIVFDDAALDQAVEGIVNGIYFNQGHVCCAGSRLFVQESIYEPRVAKLKRRLDDAARRRPARQEHRRRRDQLRGAAREDQASSSRAGRRRAPRSTSRRAACPEKGYWFAPTVFTNVAQSYRIAQEEIFGPVLSVLTFRTPDEAVEKANNTPYGLSAGVWTEKGSRILWMAQRLRAGVVWANTYNRFDPASPFGGYKESGFGREGGLHGLEPYLEFEDEPAARSSKTYKLFIGGAFPRSESGRTYEAEGQNVARASRKDARDAVRAARGAFPKWAGADRVQPRPGALPGRRDARGPPSPSSPSSARGRGRGRALDRPLRLVRGLGRQAARRCSAASNPVAGPYFNFTVPEPHRRRRHPRARGAAAARARLAARPGARRRQRGRRGRLRGAAARRDRARRGARDSDVPGGVVNILTGRTKSSRRGSRGTWT